MKAIKKLLVLMMAAVLSLSVFSFAGCGKTDPDKIVDKTKTQVYVYNFNGGFGSDWLDAAVRRFEEAYKDYEGLDGKVGVQVMVEKDKITATGVLAGMSGNKNYVLFTEGVNYFDFVTQGVCLDLTTMVNETLPGEERSIMDKLSPTMQEALKYGEDEKVYMIPHYAGYNGITLDIDLMDAKAMFLGKDGKFNYRESDRATAGDTTGASGKLTAGQDGVFGTYDDGLPATYDEFFDLVRTMKQRGVDPIGWSGHHQWYVQTMMMGMAANAMGAAGAEAMYTFNNPTLEVVDMSKPITDVVAGQEWNLQYSTQTISLTEETGYEAFRQPAFLTALSFVDYIVDGGYYYSSSFNDGTQHTDIQNEFLQSRLDQDGFEKPVGMLVEGCWWQQEAAQTFKDLDDLFGDAGRDVRKLRFLPFPHVNESKIGSGQVLLEANNCYGFINSKTPEEYQEISLAFLQFINTDVSLREFTRITNTTKAMNYTMTEEDYEEMSYFGRSLMEIQSAPNTTIVYPMGTSDTFIAKKSAMNNQDMWTMSTTVKAPTQYFKGASSRTASEYFKALYNNWKGSW